jgi:hypothetical protein
MARAELRTVTLASFNDIIANAKMIPVSTLPGETVPDCAALATLLTFLVSPLEI